MAVSSLVFFLLLLLLLSSFSEAREILVGGKRDAWKIPSSESDSLNKWAESSRFRVGDYLVWKFDEAKDSVMEVTKEAYEACNTTNPVVEHKDGTATVKLGKPGPVYFISGAKGHCEQGQKVIVVVMTPRNRFFAISPAPAPSSGEFDGPAVAPTSSSVRFKAGFVGVLGILMLGLF